MSLQVRIASPCEEKWEGMQGDARVRFCARCQLNVYNVKELTEVEVRALFLQTEGRVCGRVFQRRDGTVLTKDCPTGLAALRKRALAGVTLAVALLSSLVGFRVLSGKAGCDAPRPGVEGWFARVVGSRLETAKEELRDTKTFGPLIDKLDPPERYVAGRMMLVPVTKGPAGTDSGG